MRALAVVGWVVSLVACTVSPSDPVTENAATEPFACAQATELVRCSSAATNAYAAAFCGELIEDNSLRVTGAVTRTCGAIDVPGIVAGALARGGIVDGGTSLANVSQAQQVVDLGCGRHRFSSIGLNDELTLNVRGHTVILVDGDVRIAGPLEVIVAPGARLDFVVTGDFSADNMVTFRGGETWLAIGGRLRVASPVSIDGWLVAPGEIAADNTLSVDGALYAGGLRVASPVTVTGSRRVAGDGCVAP